MAITAEKIFLLASAADRLDKKARVEQIRNHPLFRQIPDDSQSKMDNELMKPTEAPFILMPNQLDPTAFTIAFYVGFNIVRYPFRPHENGYQRGFSQLRGTAERGRITPVLVGIEWLEDEVFPSLKELMNILDSDLLAKTETWLRNKNTTWRPSFPPLPAGGAAAGGAGNRWGLVTAAAARPPAPPPAPPAPAITFPINRDQEMDDLNRALAASRISGPAYVDPDEVTYKRALESSRISAVVDIENFTFNQAVADSLASTPPRSGSAVAAPTPSHAPRPPGGPAG
jgi:hypothetical protein